MPHVVLDIAPKRGARLIAGIDVNCCATKGLVPQLGWGFRFVAQDNAVGSWLLAKCDGKARPMTVIAGNNLQIAANLLYEPEDELHPKPFALGSLKSNG